MIDIISGNLSLIPPGAMPVPCNVALPSSLPHAALWHFYRSDRTSLLA